MRRILIISLATLVLVIGVAGAAPATYAAIGSACSEENDSACDPATSYCELIQNSPQYNTCVPNSQMAADAATAQTSVTAASSGQNNPINDLTNSDSGYNTVMLKIMGLFAWLLGVAIVTLDYTVYYTVVKMGSYVNSLSAIGVAWRILRDFANIMLIFGFLGAGIATILNIDLYGWSTKMLPKLLIAAVLINFSLFVSEAMIDGTNLLATQFYTQINGGKLPTGNFPSYTAIEGTQSSGISGKIMAQLGMQQIYGKAVNNQDVFKGSAPWYLGFMGILLFITAAFVMFSLAFILIARFVALIFLILVSPVAFMGWAVPWLEYRMSQWWKNFLEQIVTAPVLLLLLYVALAVITDVNFLTVSGSGGTPDWTGTMTGNLNGFASILLSFFVAMGLLMVVVMKAKSMSAVGAAGATKLGGRLTGALSFGAASLAGRGILGTTGYMLNNKYVQRRAAQKGALGLGAKALAFTGRNLEKRTFDFRNVPGVKRATSSLGGAGLEGVFAAGATVTAKTALDKTKEGLKYIKPFSGDWWRNQQKEYEEAKTELDRKDVIKAGVSDNLRKEFKKMSDDELTELKGIRKGLTNFVEALSPATYGNLMKSQKLLPGEKDKIRSVWEGQFKGEKAAATISRFSTEEIASLDGKTLAENKDVTDALGPTELDAIRRKNSLNQTQRRAIFEHLTKHPTLNKEFFNYLGSDATKGREKYWNVDNAPLP